jgi:putative ABC transport system permease protein
VQALAERAGATSAAMAAGAIRRSLSRAGGSAAALAVALAMTIGVLVMVSSFELEVRRWIEATLPADVYVADANQGVTRARARVPAAVVEAIRRDPAVVAVDTLRAIEVPYGESTILFCGGEIDPGRSASRFELIEGDPARALRDTLAGAALISEPLANHHDLAAGETLEVQGLRGPETFPIAGVFRDFSYDRGYAFTGRDRFIEAFGDPGVRNLAAHLDPSTDPARFAERLRQRFAADYGLRIRSTATLRREILEVFRRTFALTYVLQVVATAFALAGVGVTLLGLFLERAREIATLRSLGASLGRIAAVVSCEACLVALVPALAALPLGALLAWILIHVVNLRAFGWSIPMTWSWGSTLGTAALAVAAALASTLLPLWAARRQSLAEALREE